MLKCQASGAPEDGFLRTARDEAIVAHRSGDLDGGIGIATARNWRPRLVSSHPIVEGLAAMVSW